MARGNATDKGLALSDERIKGIKVPMLALVGADDPLRAGVDALKGRLPAVQVVVIDKADLARVTTRKAARRPPRAPAGPPPPG